MKLDMYWLFLAVVLMTGANLLTLPFSPIPMLLGAAYAAFFIWSLHLAEKFKVWTVVVFMILSAIAMWLFLGKAGFGTETRVLVSTLSFIASLWYMIKQYRSKS